ncbi:hypothetical protein SLEP1_g15017 [Rubroshorea leprosula]|uniref:Uncharacterized protein n=1 Tax=Rubroshorea leprosula TaxID=152421 RepID=A0AAV5IRX4_9ROSI|nr:hypothetical protein SLEP1_g15017 [Rubroshorea leprosula]
MSSAFATKFSNRRLIRKTTYELMRVKQRDGESLKNFMSRFNDAVLEVNSFDQAVGITAVISGLSHERFRDSLLKRPANTFSEIKNKMDLRRPGPMRTAAATKDHTRYCDFHQDHGYTTEQCNSLRSELESLAQKGMLNEYIQRVEQPRFVREQGPQNQGVRNPPNRQGVGYQQAPPPLPPPARVIHMITGGLEVGGLSSKQRKLYVKERVLVDSGSAPDIMYFHCFESLGLDPALWQRYDGPIYGFNNQPVPVEGVFTMNVAFGSGRSYVTLSVRFLVVKVASSFNAVIGRPTLTEIRAVGKAQTPEINPKRIPDDRQVMGVEIVDNRPEDETRVALIEDVEEKPVAQKQRLFEGERLKVIKEEVEKLLQAGFIRRVDYCEWVANPVLVKKANGKWRMCIDYTNLNDACPKDCYPMPNIDKLVESASGNERLSLLDAYSGYHQVPMALEDEEKTSFYTGNEIYCYVMMPFGLKNAGATYQKMVTIVFRAQIGRNLEVYVDDIVNRIRLNLAKCIFGVESGKFLGFMVSQRGIEVNPEKIRAIAEMEPPKSVKDIQRLTGRVVALHRFISKSADKCLPFFKIMSSPPLLTKAKDGEILYLYLGISDEAISSVLVREEAKQQKPIYYISSVLHGVELRYPIAEKAALAVVTLARKLRPYFQSHPIIILTDQPLRQILQKPECSGRLVKWAIELGEFEIAFQQRFAIRAQALVDFIVECTPGNSIPTLEPNDWTLYVDGASSSKGSGAGALLIGPDGYRSEHALKFNFGATNNMAEYEALLLGLQLALELKLSVIQVYSDSQLVVNQINSICEVVDPVMVKYVALVAELKCKFQKFCLSKIPRTENEQADSLSKFPSDSSSHSRSVFVEVLDEPSFMKPRVMEISTDPGTSSWTDPILSFLRDGIVPTDRQEEMKLRRKASREVHEGVCGSHMGARTLAHKVLRQGYYWPNMYKDATQFIQRCQKCQFFAHLIHQPAEELTTLMAPWPFAQWGLDLLGPFVKGVGCVTHLIVGVDYFTKWVEARALSSLTSKKVEDFVFSSIICRYGIPNQIIADNGTQFNCSSFRDFCSSYGIKLQFTSVYHPESNGMVESVNKCILEGIKPRLEQHKAKWADELNNVLWAYKTTSRTATGETPYHLAFGTEAVIPIEIGVPSFRVTHFNEGQNGQLLRENLDLLDEVREEARLRTLVYKQKLAPNWEGPYTVAEVPHPSAYILQDTGGKRVPRVWNANNLKKFYP